MPTRLSLTPILVAAALAAGVPAYAGGRTVAGDEVVWPNQKTQAEQKSPAEQNAKTGRKTPEQAAADKADRKAAKEISKQLGKVLKGGELKEGGRYEMSADELAMDCKRLTGSMKITINRLRDAATRSGGSGLAEATHKSMPMLFGGSTASADRQASLARERAKLDAYNRQLAARNCKTLDVEAELARAPQAPVRY